MTDEYKKEDGKFIDIVDRIVIDLSQFTCKRLFFVISFLFLLFMFNFIVQIMGNKG